ncbi:hypothetical protein Slin15195_G108660 [Septoria linicola]|uniref:Uncharacterized protein n=1 Tax=Septoria linicola TaxID=215465 RepID=A0A9Q9AX51_9PEZI|nr:hypothetical protein Slin14017_G106960 [Septoria linicola]USW57547.1 hypothetical protein Slin15195_G108660 [Septoria linicola]
MPDRPTGRHAGPATLPSNGSCPFLDMAEELRVIIYQFAYGHKYTNGLVAKGEIDERHGKQAREGNASSSLPVFKHAVDELMVCKRFFAGAAPVLCTAQVLVNPDREYHGAKDTVKSLLLQAYVRSAEKIHCNDLYEIGQFSSLRHLDITIGAVFDESDFVELPLVVRSKALRGLQSFSIIPDSNHYADTPEKEATWASSIQALQQYIMSLVTKPKGPHHNRTARRDGQNTLYPGSRVSMIYSTLLPAEDEYVYADVDIAAAEQDPEQMVIGSIHGQPVHAPRSMRAIPDFKMTRENPFLALSLQWQAKRTQELLWKVPGATMGTVYATHQAINHSIGRAIAIEADESESAKPMTGNDVAAEMGMTGFQLYDYIYKFQQAHPDFDSNLE